MSKHNYEHGPTIAAVDVYRSYGDNRPDKDVLAAVSDVLGRSGRSSMLMQTHADVLIDLAVADPENSDEHIVHAKDRLNGVIEVTNGTDYSDRAVKACLLKSELHAWAQAAKGEAVEVSYVHLLFGAIEAVRLQKGLSKEAACKRQGASALTEFIPTLLAARSFNPRERWLSRSSLRREDCRKWYGQGVPPNNPNWDVGTSFFNNAQDYISPQLKVQIKNNFTTRFEEDSYGDAGVFLMSARNLAFNRTFGIIDGCQAECEPINAKNYAKPEQLDSITARLRRLMLEATIDHLTEPATEVPFTLVSKEPLVTI